jgi:hypothetical protein
VILPEPGRFPDAWLADAELSVAVGDPDRVGLSFFSNDADAFAAFTERIGLPADARADAAQLRARFDLLPRHWVKLRWRAGVRAGWSEYFTIQEHNVYPITTLRLFVRRYGVADTSRLEPALAPALEREDTRWVVSVRRADGAPVPRLSARVPRPVLRELATTLVAAGFVDRDRAARYLEHDVRLRAGDAAWITLDAATHTLCGVDFEDPDAGSLPDGWRDATGANAAPPRYLKCRLAPGASRPEWVLYLPAAT